jgi:hypothetical protein
VALKNKIIARDCPIKILNKREGSCEAVVEATSPLGARKEAENFLEESLAPFTLSISCTMEDK